MSVIQHIKILSRRGAMQSTIQRTDLIDAMFLNKTETQSSVKCTVSRPSYFILAHIFLSLLRQPITIYHDDSVVRM